MDSYRRIHDSLDEDERIIFPSMFKASPWLYDKVDKTVWLVYVNGEITWAVGSSVERVIDAGGEVLAEMILVRVRPNNDDVAGDMISYDHYHDNRDLYEVLDLRLKIAEREPPHSMCVVSADTYNEMRATHDIVDVMYFVRTKGDFE